MSWMRCSQSHRTLEPAQERLNRLTWHRFANGRLILQTGSVREEDQTQIVFLLDLDFVTIDAAKVPLEDALEWVEQGHSQIETGFEACITEGHAHCSRR